MKKGSTIELEIEDLAYGGKGISKIDTEKGKYVVFVANSIPGQRVKARIVKKRTSYSEARLLEILSHSSQEIEIPYQEVSGAPYARLPIALQHEYKKRNALDVFKKFSGIPSIEDIFDEFIPSPSTWHYRNKMEYSFSSIIWSEKEKKGVDGFGLGFKRRGAWWIVENLEKESGLFDAELENNLKEIRSFCENSGFPAWHAPRSEGFFRHLIVKKSFYEDKLLVNFQTTSHDLEKFDLKGLVQLFKELFSDRLKGLIHTVNDSQGDRVNLAEFNQQVLFGSPLLVEEILGLKFQIHVNSFFQTNPSSAEKLYSKTLDYLFSEHGTGNVLDLFCGTGTIAQLIASEKQDVTVIGVDIVEKAIEDAINNAKRNNLSELKFFTDDVGKFLKNRSEYMGKIAAIILDPPRAGISQKALTKVIEINAETIVYVSCNPATQARDAKTLIEAGYILKKLSLVDQFPHTSHIESVALFTKNKTSR